MSSLRNFERVSSVRMRLNSRAVSSFFLFFAHRSRYAQESHDLQNLREMHPNRCRTETTNSIRILKLQTQTNSSGQFQKFNRKESHSLKFKLCFNSCDHLCSENLFWFPARNQKTKISFSLISNFEATVLGNRLSSGKFRLFLDSISNLISISLSG